jgi:phosphoglycerate kinase
MPPYYANKHTLKDCNFTDKRVVIRVDFNVPIRKQRVADPLRIRSAMPTIKFVLAQKPKYIMLLTHRGRPKGLQNPQFSVRPIVATVEELLGTYVHFLPSCVGPVVDAACESAEPGTIFLCENLRFHVEEQGKGLDRQRKKIKADKAKVKAFQQALSKHCDVYVNDAFGVAHRPHSSVVGFSHVPMRAQGLLIEKEMKAFSKILNDPPRPFLAILGGAKVSDKLPMILNLIDSVDEMIITGAMAFTFLHVMKGMKIGNSLFDEPGKKLVPEILAKAKEKNVKLHFPVDFKTGNRMSYDCIMDKATPESGIPDGWMGLDIGPITRVNDAQVIWRAKSLIFNGPPGAFEVPQFAYGTITTLHNIAAATKLGGCISIIGGGDTASAAARYKVTEHVTHISTGGGSSVALLEGRVLPGISFLSDRPKPSL